MTESILRLVPPTDVDPLYDLAPKIRDKLARADNLDERADNARLAAGRLLCEARDLCQQRGKPWEAWCKEHVWNRSLSDIRKVMALAGAPDPEAAHQAAKEATRKQVAAHRDRAYVSAVSQEPSVELDLAALQSAVKALSTADFTAFKTWFFGYCGRS